MNPPFSIGREEPGNVPDQRKPYTSPKLVVCGTVKDLTQTTNTKGGKFDLPKFALRTR